MNRIGQSPTDSMDSDARWPHDAVLHAWWVEPGRLLAGEFPGARTPEKTRQKLRVLAVEGYDAIAARIRGEIDAGRTVYVHCWGGKGRTTTVIGCLLIDGGLDYDAAIARIAELRAGTRKAIDVCPESASQHRLLRERAAHH